MSRLIHVPERRVRVLARTTTLVIAVLAIGNLHGVQFPKISANTLTRALELSGVIATAEIVSTMLLALAFTNWQTNPVRNDRYINPRRFHISYGNSLQLVFGSWLYALIHTNLGWRERDYYQDHIRIKSSRPGYDGRMLFYMRLICNASVLLLIIFIGSIAGYMAWWDLHLGHYRTVNVFASIMSGIVILGLAIPFVIGLNPDSDVPTSIRAWAQTWQFRRTFTWLITAIAWLIRAVTLIMTLRLFGAPMEIWTQIGVVVTAQMVGQVAGYISMMPGGIVAYEIASIIFLSQATPLTISTVSLAILLHRLCTIATRGVFGIVTVTIDKIKEEPLN